MNTGFGVIQVSLRFVIESSDHSVSNHLPSPRRSSGFCCVGLTGPYVCGRPFGAVRQLGFTSSSQARRNGRPNRVHLRYGLIVHLRLLSTPPRGDAVTVSYGVPEHSGMDFHPADSMQLQAHGVGRPARQLPSSGKAILPVTWHLCGTGVPPVSWRRRRRPSCRSLGICGGDGHLARQKPSSVTTSRYVETPPQKAADSPVSQPKTNHASKKPRSTHDLLPTINDRAAISAIIYTCSDANTR
jgi:hypothetical protein